MMPSAPTLRRTLALFAIASGLWGTEIQASHFLTQDPPLPDTAIKSMGVGQAVEVVLDHYPDGDVRLEFEVQSPNSGSKRSLGTSTGTVRNGRARITGTLLGPDERWHHIRVKVYSPDGKLLGTDSRLVE